jgi:hypothetical protein
MPFTPYDEHNGSALQKGASCFLALIRLFLCNNWKGGFCQLLPDEHQDNHLSLYEMQSLIAALGRLKFQHFRAIVRSIACNHIPPTVYVRLCDFVNKIVLRWPHHRSLIRRPCAPSFRVLCERVGDSTLFQSTGTPLHQSSDTYQPPKAVPVQQRIDKV